MRKHVTDPQLMHCPGGRDSCLALLCFSFVCPISLQFSCYFTKHFSSLSLMGLALTRCLHKCPSSLRTVRTVTWTAVCAAQEAENRSSNVPDGAYFACVM